MKKGSPRQRVTESLEGFALSDSHLEETRYKLKVLEGNYLTGAPDVIFVVGVTAVEADLAGEGLAVHTRNATIGIARTNASRITHRVQMLARFDKVLQTVDSAFERGHAVDALCFQLVGRQAPEFFIGFHALTATNGIGLGGVTDIIGDELVQIIFVEIGLPLDASPGHGLEHIFELQSFRSEDGAIKVARVVGDANAGEVHHDTEVPFVELVPALDAVVHAGVHDLGRGLVAVMADAEQQDDHDHHASDHWPIGLKIADELVHRSFLLLSVT